MLTTLFAAATAALFGTADFLGGLASRRASAVVVTAVVQLIGLALFTLAVALFPAPVERQDALAGAAAGVCGGIGVLALYGALARGAMSLVAPITAALSGSLPAVFDLLRGSRPSVTATVGLVLALIATVIVSAASTGEEVAAHHRLPRKALALALVSGLAFAGSFVSFSFSTPDSGVWPLLSARVVSSTLLVVVALIATRGHPRLPTSARPSAFGAGLLDAMANVTMLTAIRLGPLAVASVVGSLYPIGTVLLARFVLHERLDGWQRFGVALAFVAVVLAAWP